MKFEVEQSKIQAFYQEIGNPAWSTYHILYMYTNNSILEMSQKDIADLMKVTQKTVKRHIDVLLTTRIGGYTLVEKVPSSSGSALLFNTYDVIADKSMVIGAQKRRNPTDEIFDYWLQQYRKTYDHEYPITDWKREKAMAKKLGIMFAGDVEVVKAIIDKIMEVYPFRFRSSKFPNPALAGTVSFMAKKVEPEIRAALHSAEYDDVSITDDSGMEVFNRYKKAFKQED